MRSHSSGGPGGGRLGGQPGLAQPGAVVRAQVGHGGLLPVPVDPGVLPGHLARVVRQQYLSFLARLNLLAGGPSAGASAGASASGRPSHLQRPFRQVERGLGPPFLVGDDQAGGAGPAGGPRGAQADGGEVQQGAQPRTAAARTPPARPAVRRAGLPPRPCSATAPPGGAPLGSRRSRKGPRVTSVSGGHGCGTWCGRRTPPSQVPLPEPRSVTVARCPSQSTRRWRRETWGWRSTRSFSRWRPTESPAGARARAGRRVSRRSATRSQGRGPSGAVPRRGAREPAGRVGRPGRGGLEPAGRVAAGSG